VKPKLTAKEALVLYGLGLAVAFGFFLLGLNWGRIGNAETRSTAPAQMPVPSASQVSETTTRLDLYTPVAPKPDSAVPDQGSAAGISKAEEPVSSFVDPPADEADVIPAFGEALTIQVGALNSEAEARKLLLRLEARGYSGILDLPKPNVDKYYRVRIGTYDSRDAAKRVEALLKSEGFLTYIRKLEPGGAVR
jgi:cell division septation protein DedD